MVLSRLAFAWAGLPLGLLVHLEQGLRLRRAATGRTGTVPPSYGSRDQRRESPPFGERMRCARGPQGRRREFFCTFYPILFYFILLCSVLFYSMISYQFHCVLFWSIYHIIFSVLLCSIILSSIHSAMFSSVLRSRYDLFCSFSCSAVRLSFFLSSLRNSSPVFYHLP